MNLPSIRSITLVFASAALLSFPSAWAEVAEVDVKAAAEKGSAEAQYKLGLAHRKGEGVKKDGAEALKWMQKAAEQGLADAQHDLGKDLVLAHLYLTLSLKSGKVPEAQSGLKELEKIMKPDQVEASRGLAKKWKPGAAGQ